MNRLKSTTIFPPGGWQYRQPETGWQAPTPLGSTFTQTVLQIRSHRLSNSGFNLVTDIDAIGIELEAYTCARLGGDPTFCQEGGDFPKSKAPLEQPTAPVGHERFAFLAGDVEGAKVIAQWFGDGGRPVDQLLADARAETCRGCAFNTEYRIVTGAIANTVRRLVGLKNGLKLTVAHEESLGACAKCGCHLPTKIWVPLRHLTRDDDQERFPAHCWVNTERIA